MGGEERSAEEGRLRPGWEGRWFEDFDVGDRYEHPLGRTVTTTDNLWFTLLTQNTAPVHVDHHYASQTAWGRHLYATGDDAEAARLAGIRTRRVLLSAYVVAGAVVGISAWILVGRIQGADPNAGINLNLESITAVVIGGTSLFGGRGAVVGSLLGALIVQVFDNGLALAGVDPNYQVLAVGVLVIAAVAADQWIRSVKS